MLWLAFFCIVSSTEIIELFEKGEEEIKGSTSFGKLDSIVLTDVVFGFKDGAEILSNIDLTINKNETIAFVGPSGSGKTTLVNLIVGLFDQIGGEIQVNGLSRSTINMLELHSGACHL